MIRVCLVWAHAGLRLPGTGGGGSKTIKGKKLGCADQLVEEFPRPMHQTSVSDKTCDGQWCGGYVCQQIWSICMQSFSKYNDGVKYVLNVIDVVSKYVWSIPLHDNLRQCRSSRYPRIYTNTN